VHNVALTCVENLIISTNDLCETLFIKCPCKYYAYF